MGEIVSIFWSSSEDKNKIMYLHAAKHKTVHQGVETIPCSSFSFFISVLNTVSDMKLAFSKWFLIFDIWQNSYNYVKFKNKI